MRINADKVVVYDPWTNAPIGALLQMYSPSEREPVIGMRTVIERPGGNPTPYLALLTGGHIGNMLGADVLASRPALDMSEFLDINVEISSALAPTPAGQNHQPQLGQAYFLAPHGTMMLVILSTGGGAMSYLTLSNTNGNRGQWFPPGGPIRHIGVIVVEPKP